MSIPTDNSNVSEPDSHSDSDWLDITSTDRDSDDNDSIYSSRETDHEDLSRSRSRRSSLSYGSSRDGDIDAWEGIIDDSADEGMPNDVLAPHPHVLAPSRRPDTCDLDPTQESSPEELRVKEGLDQSMMSTLSSSRSSSLHTSTVHNSSRDLRLSFPDPITSSCREPLSTSYEEIQRNSDALPSPTDSDVPSDVRLADDEDMLSASQIVSAQPLAATVLPGPELQVFLYGSSPAFKWSMVNRLLQRAVHGAGLTITLDLDSLHGSLRHLTVSGSFERDPAFPRTITILDRTLQLHDVDDDLALMHSTAVRPLAIVFMPCRPLYLPEHVLYLPVQTSPSRVAEFPALSDIETAASQDVQETLNIPGRQLLQITDSEDVPVVNNDSIDMLDSTRVYRAFSRLWSGDNNMTKGIMTGTHALTIIAILSLVLGIVVRAALPVSLQQFTPPALPAIGPNYSSGFLWQILRPTPHRAHLPPASLDNSLMAVSTSFRELSLSVFSAESTAMTLSRANPTNFQRRIPSTLSESTESSTDLMLQLPRSLLVTDNRPKALSVIPESIPSFYPAGPTASAHPVSALAHTSVPEAVKEYGTTALEIVNQDMQDIFDALDALAQAILRQTQTIILQATALIEQSVEQWEKGVASFEMVKETLHGRNEHARKRAKEIKERGTKWLYEASEAFTAGAQLSKGMAWEVAEGLASRAQRARGRAKEIAAEMQDFWNEHDRVEALGVGSWDVSIKRWDTWVWRAGDQEKLCELYARKLRWATLC